MAKPMPRGRALRMLGGAVVTLATPAFLARPASASVGVSQAGCQSGVCGVPFIAGCVTAVSKCPAPSLCFKWPGFLGSIPRGGAGGLCAQAGNAGATPPGGLACCCPPGTTKGNVEGGEPPCVAKCKTPLCGPKKQCCEPDQECKEFELAAGGTLRHQCVAKCEPGSRRCAKDLDCCPNGQACCGSGAGACCGPDQICVRALNRNGQFVKLCMRKCVAPEVRCNFVCCNANQVRAFRKLRNGRIKCHCVQE
jgi:hypothetical protein